MIELSISLVLIAGLLLGGFYIIRGIRADTQRKLFTESITRSLAAVNKYIATFKSTTGITVEVIMDMGGWPQERKMPNPLNQTVTVAKSTIPDAWEDVAANSADITDALSGKTYVVAYKEEGIIYRINRVPSTRCVEVIGELARYPSVAKVSAVAWTANVRHPGTLAGTEVAKGTNVNTSKNFNVQLNGANINTMCNNAYVSVLALVVQN